MKLKLLYRGDQHQMDISSDARLADLRQEIFARTSVPPENQKLLPKPAKGISGLAACSDDQTRCLDDCGIRDGLAIMVVGATVAEVDQIQHREKEESRWKQPRNYHPSMLKGTKARTTGKGDMASLAATTSPFTSLSPHASLSESNPLHAKVLEYLSRLANDPGIIHVCHLHNYRVGLLTELLPWENPELLGLNENKGQTIRLRIRTDHAEGFRNYRETRAVLIHELAHIDVSDHPPEFKILNSKLNAELAAFEKSAREGTHMLHDGDMYVPPEETSAEGAMGMRGGSYRLGGKDDGLSSGPGSSDQRRQAVLDATLKRLEKLEEEIEVGCGSGSNPSNSPQGPRVK